MKRTTRRRALGGALTLLAVGLLATTTTTAAGAAVRTTSQPAARAVTTCSPRLAGPTRIGHVSGIVHPMSIGCAPSHNSQAANGTPPLLWHGGPVMSTKQTGPLVITPIFWNPAGHSMTFQYKFLITRYLLDVALSSFSNSNVYSVSTEYSGSNGQIRHGIILGLPVNDTAPLPPDGCTVAANDTSAIYADGTGYDACLDDNQVQAEISRVVAARHMPVDLAHIYVLYTPKHVESCILPGSTLTAANNCTINYQPSATYCAYHSIENDGTVYANMPFPIYGSATRFTCSSDARFPTVQTPNGNPDADTEVSPTSHEVNEAMTDPDTVTGWFDSSGFENGDECAYVFGPTQGATGRAFNQTLGFDHWLTQEEFSNQDFSVTGLGCVQGENQVAK
ncbi:MAG TPA: hypothetical protein VKU39_16615 [Streptosporangiaceae bacterium]|nr:hypothetical protein [Streptosporangiaceae bacterium]